MALLGDMVVRIVGDTAQFVKAIDQSGKKLTSFEKDLKKITDTMSKVGKKMTMFVTLPILGIGAAFAKAAADAEEVNSKFNIVFKDQAEGVREWAKGFSEATGRANVDNLKFLASVQDLFVPLGIARDKAADLSKSVVTLATDVGSFNNLPTADVLRDIQSALVGNHETVRKYGVVLSEATINQELLNIGVEGGYKAANAAEKAIARYNLIVAGTADAQGDAVRTAGSFTNQFRALQSSAKDLAESFGTLMLPALQKIVERITKAIRWIGSLDDSQKRLIITIAGIAAAIGPTLIVMAKMITTIQMIGRVISSVNLSMLATPWGLAVAGAVALAAVIWKLTEAQREEKKLDKDIIALKDELYKVRGEEQVRIQETIVAKLREAFVGAEAHAMEMEQIAQRGRAMGRGNVQTSKWQQMAERSREKSNRLQEAFAKENEALVRLTEMNQEAVKQRIIGLPVLETETEDTKENTEVKKEQIEANWEMADSYDGIGAHIATNMGIYREWRATWDKEAEATERNAEALTNYRATALEAIQATTEAHNERHAIITANLKREQEVEVETVDHMKTIRQAAMQFSVQLINSLATIRSNYYAQLLENEQLTEDERKQIQYDAAVSAKNWTMFQAVITGAQAIISGFATKPFLPVGLAMGALATVLTGAQIAAISSTPLPQLAGGGVIAELHPNEAIIPLDSSAAVDQMVEALNRAQTAPNVTTGEQLFHVTVNLGAKTLYDDITKATRDRRILISAGAVA